MADEQLTTALQSSREIQITVTGRRSGREIALPVWFVQEGDKLYLVPVYGSDTNWYKNVLDDPATRVSAGGRSLTARATPITDPARVAQITDMFRAKYGDRDFEAYYPKHDVAVEVPLS